MNFRGSVPLMVLSILSQGPKHGYSIAQYIEKESDGFFEIKAGTLYPTLHNLEKQAMIKSRHEIANGRELRYYQLTQAGKARLKDSLREWRGHIKAVNRILSTNT